MIDQEQAAEQIRRLSRLKNYPRSWESATPAAAQQDQQAELALIQAASEAPSVHHLRRWVADWERQHVESPVPAALYAAWRSRGEYVGVRRRRNRCDVCDGMGWITRNFVQDAIAADNEKIYIGEDEVDDWWERIRSVPSCTQRVYSEAVKCGCGGTQQAVEPDPAGDAKALRQLAKGAD